MIIGITGTNGAGKGAIVEYLVKNKGFRHFSMGGYLMERLREEGKEISRLNLINKGNELRSQGGSGYVVQELLKKAQEAGGEGIIESIRTEGEIEKLHQTGAVLLGVDADRKIRYERAIKRGEDKDKVSYEEFCRIEDGEMESDDPNKQNLKRCLELADFVLVNNSTIEELNQKIEEILKIIEKK